jgi:VanZ family protein
MRSVGRLAPALLLMGLIFFLSAQSSLPKTETDFDIALRKLAHMTEFGLLWLLWLRALRPSTTIHRAAFIALGICVAYAISDEFHQSFVADRHPSPFDVAIDTAGMGVAVAVWLTWRRRRPHAA